MPLVNFICPDNEQIPIKACLEECRMETRCVTLPTLMLMSKRREWKGVLSTTQALNGTRLTYLQITKEYGERPVDRAFALLGTFHHIRMQNVSLPDHLTEEWLEDELGSGMFDFYDAANKVLYDYKTCGGYKINRVLGKIRAEEIIPEGDPEAGVYSRGPRKGQPKTRAVWGLGERDDFDWRMQLSRYAWLLEGAGFPVNEITVQATVRDYNTMTAKQYGLNRQIYLVSLDRFPKETVEKFYERKNGDLRRHLEEGTLPAPCSPRERWADNEAPDDETPGKRCGGYCPVWMYCDLGIKARDAKKEEEHGDRQEQ